MAAYSPSHCFEVAIEAARIALKYRTPVILLSDGYLANGSEPWRLPELSDLPDISVPFATEPNHTDADGNPEFWPYLRDPETLARPWAVPGTPGLMHRIGGIEKEDGTGNISYEPANHERMVHLRADKVAGIATRHPAVRGRRRRRRRHPRARLGLDLGRDRAARSTAAGPAARRWPAPTSCTSTRSPGTWARCCQRYPRVLVPEMNLGQLVEAGPGRVPRRRPLGHQGPGRALHRRRARSRHPQGTGRLTVAVTDVPPPTTRKDWTSDQEVRWCPGCGDYSILTAVQLLMPELDVRRENTVFLSGIGCAARFPYYMNTYGMHSIHGRAPAIATGLAMARDDLDVWVVTGDGDALSIGGNHLIHALRRNVNLTILLFNNQIYGLTKGQYSPTSELGKVTKSTPFGSLDQPFNPVSLALGAEATFVARTHDMDRAHMTEMFRRAHEHKGAAFVEVYQNCNVFNDGAFEGITKKDNRESMLIPLVHGEPIVFGPEQAKGVALDGQGRRPHRRRGRRRRSATSSSTTRPARSPGWPSCCPGCRPVRPSPRRSACSVPSSGPTTAPRRPGSSRRHRSTARPT